MAGDGSEGTRVISISIRPRELALVGRAARERGLSRSRFVPDGGCYSRRALSGDHEPRNRVCRDVSISDQELDNLRAEDRHATEAAGDALRELETTLWEQRDDLEEKAKGLRAERERLGSQEDDQTLLQISLRTPAATAGTKAKLQELAGALAEVETPVEAKN